MVECFIIESWQYDKMRIRYISFTVDQASQQHIIFVL